MVPQEKSDETYVRYNHMAVSFVRQYARECGRDDVMDMEYEDRSVAAAKWFLEQNGRWRKSSIRLTSAALSQWIENLGAAELISPEESRRVIVALQTKRPESKQEKRRAAKSIKLANLRRLIRFFGSQNDAVSQWIAGYLSVAVRIGWRPGEILALSLDGKWLRAPAEKNTNERGLCPTCEVGLHKYPDWIIEKLEAWISETGRLTNEHGGTYNFYHLFKQRLYRACDDLKIRRISPYTLRHVAIAGFKKSGFTRQEIAVIVNHASDRTATERYGKCRTGTKRPKKMLRIAPWRLELVRSRARERNSNNTPRP